MNVVAVECSAVVGSVAFLEGPRVVCRRDLPPDTGRSSALFTVLEELRVQSAWEWSGVDLFAAGRGPGRYSGMRVALTAVQGLAAPAQRPVHALSSGAALAHDVAAARSDVEQVAVLGDARRSQVWYAVFVREGKALRQVDDWALATPSELAGALPPEALLVSSDGPRLRESGILDALAGYAWMEGDPSPRAETVGALALDAFCSGRASEPLTPIYLHPAVKTP